MKLFRFFIPVLAFATLFSANAAEPARFEPAVSTLSGRVLFEYVMVPGEAMSKGITLFLNPPETIEGNPDSQKNKRKMRNVTKVLLHPATEDLDLAVFAGQSVTVEGLIFREYADIFHTEVSMQVQSIREDAAD